MPNPTRRGTEFRNDIKMVLDQRPTSIQYVGSQVLPEIYVSATSGDFKDLGAGIGHKLEDTKRAPNGTFNSGTYSLGDKSFTTGEYGYQMPAERTEGLIVGDYYDNEVLAGEIARDTLLVNREKRVSDAVFNTTTFAGSDYSLTPATKWDATGSTIVQDIKTASAKIRKRFGITQSALTLTLSDLLLDHIIDAMILDGIDEYIRALATSTYEEQVNLVKRYLKIGNLIVARSYFDASGMDNKEVNFTALWQEDMASLSFISQSGQAIRGGLGRQPVYQKYTKDYVVDTYYTETDMTDWTRCREYRGEYVDKQYGFLFKDVLS